MKLFPIDKQYERINFQPKTVLYAAQMQHIEDGISDTQAVLEALIEYINGNEYKRELVDALLYGTGVAYVSSTEPRPNLGEDGDIFISTT
jgi:hypothetical protein